MALRRADGFQRYAVSLQYHGRSFLGYSKQPHENSLHGTTDLRGYRSVEGRLQQGLDKLFPNHWENLQVSSRTDRGVHALKNTLHVDVLPNSPAEDVVLKLRKALNFELSRQPIHHHHPRDGGGDDEEPPPGRIRPSRRQRRRRHSNNELKILNAAMAPEYMPNDYSKIDPRQPPIVDWNARFSATDRTYMYRILWHNDNENNHWGIPFEWDQSWNITGRHCDNPFDWREMQQAANYMVGTHDFSTFRAQHCQRHSPVVTMKSIQIHSRRYCAGGLLGFDTSGDGEENNTSSSSSSSSAGCWLVTIKIVGTSFLYRQVRNMVGCLVEVGKGNLRAEKVRELLENKSRPAAPSTAPAHGLFLVDVQHGDFHI